MRNVKDVFLNGECLKDMIENHQKWIRHEDGGKRLRIGHPIDGDLRSVDFSGMNLDGIVIINVSLAHSNLSNCSLKCSTLATSLHCADLQNADLRGSYLENSSFVSANLKGANLSYAKLNGSDFYNSDLTGIILDNVEYDIKTLFFAQQCPEEGSFVGYTYSFKQHRNPEERIIKLLIMEDSLRASGATRKCGCDKAKVLSIENVDGTESFNEAIGVPNQRDVIFKVGDVIEVNNFNIDARCRGVSNGIPFYITRGEAKAQLFNPHLR